MKSEEWALVFFTIFYFAAILLAVFGSAGQKSEFENMCEQSKGTPVHNGRHWECWK